MLSGINNVCAAESSKPDSVAPTIEQYADALKGIAALEAPSDWKATEESADERFFRRSAPFRAKVSPPGSAGVPLLIGGHVWGLNTRAPLRNAVVEVWQADASGRFDNDNPAKPPPRDVFLYRARMLSDESGYFEFETVKPGAYQASQGKWRASHIRVRVQYPGYHPISTQIYFRGDLRQNEDPFFKSSLAIDLRELKLGGTVIKSGRFDMLLDPVEVK